MPQFAALAQPPKCLLVAVLHNLSFQLEGEHFFFLNFPTSEMVLRRLFISGLPETVTDEQVLERFAPFMSTREGACVEQKVNPHSGERFAFVSLSIQDENLMKCKNIYRKAKWKGRMLRCVNNCSYAFCCRIIELRKPKRTLQFVLQRRGSRKEAWKIQSSWSKRERGFVIPSQ